MTCGNVEIAGAEDRAAGGIPECPDLFPQSDHTEGFVDILRTIKEVQVSILYLELEENDYKLSFRSKGQTNVEQVARRFGGGGHTNAAACQISGPLADIQRQVIDALSTVL